MKKGKGSGIDVGKIEGQGRVVTRFDRATSVKDTVTVPQKRPEFTRERPLPEGVVFVVPVGKGKK